MLRDTQAGDLTLLGLMLLPEQVRHLPSHLHAVTVPSLYVVHSNVLRNAILLICFEHDTGLRFELQLGTLCEVSVVRLKVYRGLFSLKLRPCEIE